VHFLTGIPIVITGFAGSLFVIAVNGWMNNPVGFSLVNGSVTDVRPFDALFNDNFWHELVHMYLAGYVVAGFVVAGVYAQAWLRGKRDRYHRTALVVALSVAALAAPAQVLVGDWAARTVAERQPTKLAALEGLWRTTKGAPIHIGGIYDEGEGEVKGGIEIPKGLSLLSFHDPNATVEGLEAVSPDDRPPVNVVRFSFQTMVAIGTGLAALAALYLWVLWRKRRLPRSLWFYRAVVAAAPLSVVALICGWITTEVGRQPWIVYRVMRTSEAVTGAGGIPIGYGSLVAVYLSLGTVTVVMLRRLARRPIDIGEPVEGEALAGPDPRTGGS
jgi:cytochrome d ubiquinol oxidase subunit I